MAWLARYGNDPDMTRDTKDPDKARARKPAARKSVPVFERAHVFERSRGGPARAIADLMPEIGRTAFRRFGFVQSSVVTRWAEIVGAQHARVSFPEAIRFPPGERCDGILQLVVEPAHAPIITHLAPEVIERVNRFFGYNAIAKVKIRQGQVTVREDPGARPNVAQGAPPSLRPIPIELGDSLRDIGDAELRAVLTSLARSLNDAPAARKPE